MGRARPHDPKNLPVARPLRLRVRKSFGLAAAVLGFLSITLLGGYYSFHAAGDFSYQVGWRGTPPLAMTVDSCSGLGGGRAQTFFCFGHGDRRGADTTDGEWLLEDLSGPSPGAPS
ncbi:hypothetical protein HUT16_35445 [Kitasatospora sp. NA04385]|uniref:hypothetical protein n=1 Tax=Kitasatospora sp. NA04385 TaxID=2742135 RepID=UPI001591EB6B|nr:hypothetical protein [Kitasatospora sp. NA04385]QKW23695.1 hypothetical protein HUT16_35445 [Kitasatospora sp. NA04385]